MKTKHVESLEELVFKNRNKEYGAYSLRKNYSKTVVIALFITVLIAGSVLTYALVMNRGNNGKERTGPVVVTSDPFNKTAHEPVTLPPPPPPLPDKPNKILSFVAPKITDEAGDDDFGKQDILAENKPVPISSIDEPADKPADKQEPVMPQPEKTEPVLWVPEMPHFQGGLDEMNAYLVNNINYPSEAKEINITGTVYLSFVVEPDGSLSEIVVLRGIGGGCEEEALRVVKNMPAWVPGKQNGHPVRVRLTLPVKFTLVD